MHVLHIAFKSYSCKMKNVRKNHEKRRMQYEKLYKRYNQKYFTFCCNGRRGFRCNVAPIQAFEELSQNEMRLVLAAELAVLAIIFSAVFLSREARQQKKLRNARSSMPESERVLHQGTQASSTYYNDDYDFAA